MDPVRTFVGARTAPVAPILEKKCIRYLRFSRLSREIYSEYTDKIENFGVDESWLDVSESCRIKGDGESIAKEISRSVKFELGLTVSIGVSWNKIYAKLGSDYKKPDAITVINPDNYRQIVYPLPVGDLLYVGSSTKRRLRTLVQHEKCGRVRVTSSQFRKKGKG